MVHSRSEWSCNFYFFSWSLFFFPSNKNSAKLLPSCRGKKRIGSQQMQFRTSDTSHVWLFVLFLRVSTCPVKTEDCINLSASWIAETSSGWSITGRIAEMTFGEWSVFFLFRRKVWTWCCMNSVLLNADRKGWTDSQLKVVFQLVKERRPPWPVIARVVRQKTVEGDDWFHA